MALKNIIGQKTTTTGAIGVGATINLDGAALSAHNTFADGGAVSGTAYSVAIKDGSARQVGVATYTSGSPGTLTIDSILASTDGGSAITLTGDAEVYVDALAEDLAGGGLKSHQFFTSSGTWTKPAGVTLIKIICQGGGGGGGGSTTTDTYGGAGGGAGGLNIKYYDVSSVSSLTVTVGAGGAGGASGSDGSDGGQSKVEDGATLLVAANGGIGFRTAGGSSPPDGGSGGGTSFGDIATTGNAGHTGTESSAGVGGSGFLGGAHEVLAGFPASASFRGSGGPGSFDSGTNRAGGAGGGGFVWIEEYA